MQAIRALTNGRGTDVCVDVVGMAAKRNLLDKLSNLVHTQAGSIKRSNSRQRRSATTILLNHVGKDLREIQELLRHKNVRTNVRYTHVGYEQTRQTAEAQPGFGVKVTKSSTDLGYRLHPFIRSGRPFETVL